MTQNFKLVTQGDIANFAGVAFETSLNDALEALAKHIEEHNPSLLVSILLLDSSGRKLHRGAAPSLPESYSEKIDGIEIGASVGSCGTAVFCGHPIYVVDIDSDPLWSNYKELALSHGLRSCWSVPITSSNGACLGTFALYYQTIKNPTLEERQFIDECGKWASMLIDQARRKSA